MVRNEQTGHKEQPFKAFCQQGEAVHHIHPNALEYGLQAGHFSLRKGWTN